MRGGPDTTARYDRSVCVVKLQPDGEPACEPAANRIRRSVLVACLCSSLGHAPGKRRYSLHSKCSK
jgi:hypothetical protein